MAFAMSKYLWNFYAVDLLLRVGIFFLVSKTCMMYPLSDSFLPYSHFAHFVVLLYVLCMVRYYGLRLVVVSLAFHR